MSNQSFMEKLLASLKREYASENGTELNAVLPKMSPLNPQYLTKKQNVFQKIANFIEKFKGVGGRV
jgi:type I restriction enzyme R subunit